MTESKGRNEYLDFVKGLLIYLVVLGHTIQFIGFGQSDLFWDDRFWTIIYMFHMPLFIAISGYFSFYSIKKNKHSVYIKNRVLTLFIPLVIWSTISVLIDVTIQYFHKGVFYFSFTALMVRIESLYWFIWAIIFYSLVSSILSKIKMDNIVSYILIGFLMMFYVGHYFIIDWIETMFPFFVIGYFIAQINLQKYYSIIRKSLLLFFIISIFCFYKWNKEMYMYITPSEWKYLYITSFRLFSGIILSVVFMILTYYLYCYIKQFKISELFVSLGRASLSIYLIQTVFFYCIGRYTNLELCKDYTSLILIIPAFFLIYLFYLFMKLTNKNKIVNYLLYGNLLKK